jgi:hypothetical protein
MIALCARCPRRTADGTWTSTAFRAPPSCCCSKTRTRLLLPGAGCREERSEILSKTSSGLLGRVMNGRIRLPYPVAPPGRRRLACESLLARQGASGRGLQGAVSSNDQRRPDCYPSQRGSSTMPLESLVLNVLPRLGTPRNSADVRRRLRDRRSVLSAQPHRRTNALLITR